MKTEGKMNTKNERVICGSAKVTVFFFKTGPKSEELRPNRVWRAT